MTYQRVEDSTGFGASYVAAIFQQEATRITTIVTDVKCDDGQAGPEGVLYLHLKVKGGVILRLRVDEVVEVE